MSMGAALFIMARAVLDMKLGYWSVALCHFVRAFHFALFIVLLITLPLLCGTFWLLFAWGKRQ